MKIKDEIKLIFKNHKAALKILDENTQVLIWKKSGTRDCEIDYVFFRNMIFISGDMRDAVFNCTWKPKFNDNWETMELGYFASKMSTHQHGKYVWNSKAAVEDLKIMYRQEFEELNELEFDEMTEYILKHILDYINSISDEDDLHDIPHNEVNSTVLLQYCLAIKYAATSSSQEEYVYGIQNDLNFNDFNDFWEWGYQCGKRFNNDIEVYLAGLIMAKKQLQKRRTI